MMKIHPGLTYLFLGTTGAALIWALSLNRQLAEARAQIAAAEKKSSRTGVLVDQGSASPEKKKTERLGADENKKPDLATSDTKKSVEKDKSQGMKGFMKGLQKMMDDPSMRDAMKAQFGVQIDMMYRDLFDELNLSDEQRLKLKNLLIDRLDGIQGSSFGLFKEGMTDEDKKKVAEDLKKKTEENDQKLKEFFSSADDYEKLKRYDDSQTERMSLTQFKSSLSSQGMNLTEQQETDLMAALYRERKGFKFEVDFGDQWKPENIDQISAETLDRYTQEQNQLTEKQLGVVSKILDEKQLGAYKNHVESQKKMQAMGLQMFKEMMGGDAK